MNILMDLEWIALSLSPLSLPLSPLPLSRIPRIIECGGVGPAGLRDTRKRV